MKCHTSQTYTVIKVHSYPELETLVRPAVSQCSTEMALIQSAKMLTVSAEHLQINSFLSSHVYIGVCQVVLVYLVKYFLPHDDIYLIETLV